MVAVVASEVAVELEGARVRRIGMIALSTDLTSERDAAWVLAQSAALHVTRVPFENPTTPASLSRLEAALGEAAALLVPEVALDAIIFSCTAASATIGDGAVARAIASGRPGVPVVTPSGAARAALAALGAARVALVTPYLPATTVPMVRYFEAEGVTLTAAHCLGLEDDREMARVAAETIVGAAEAADSPEADAVFLSCTALPALALVDRLEARLGKPVVTSNQASLWRALGHAGVAGKGPGRLFARPAPAPAPAPSAVPA